MKGDCQDNIHVRSFREFITQRLPEALAAVLPLCDYEAEWTGEGKGRVSFCVGDEGVRLTFDDLPFPLPDGTFAHGSGRVVVMTADSNDLEQATIKAVGEQLMDEIAPRLVAPPDGTEWDEPMLRAWLPLDRWMREFILESNASAHSLDNTNPIARQTHLRRIVVTGPDVSFHPSQIGRVCPFETPEGPNSGRVLTLATGAEIRDGRIVPAEEQDEGALGISAGLVPALCHNEPVRQLMGANMIRQMIPPEPPEAPLVQSGLEPEDGSASLGRNFLTAFLHWKGMNYEDAIVMSESAAAKFASAPWELEVGDKLANRHGTKGVVGAILPDDEMPHLPDGRPVELLFDSMGLYSRLNFGQVIEATLGLVAEKKGEPIIAPPLRRVSQRDLRAMLREAGLPESGQFTLTDGKDGPALDEPTTVGVVYWGRLVHTAGSKVHAIGATGQEGYLGQRIGRMEYSALRTAGAYETILDAYSTRAVSEEPGTGLEARVTNGFVAKAEPPSPAFRRVQRALRGGGIAMEFDGTQARLRWATDAAGEEGVQLAEPVSHPWRPDVTVTHLSCPGCPTEVWERLVAGNRRLAEITKSAPSTVRAAARETLERAVTEVFDVLGEECAVGLSTDAYFTGRSVLAPGYALRLGEIGLPEDIAWTLFAPLVGADVGAEQTAERGMQSRRAVERVMENSIVLLNRAPTWEPTSITAFRPVLVPGRALLLHPLCCRMFNADYDGDQAAVHLPVTAAAQQEAREKLTLVGHLRRDPTVVVGHLAPSHAVLAGLAYALESQEGRAQFEALWPESCPLPAEPFTRQSLLAALLLVLDSEGPEELLVLLERLYQMGVAWATRSGASLSPFVGEALKPPIPPSSDAGPSWHAYASVVEGAIMSQADSDPTLAAPVRALRCGARGSAAHLRALIGPWAAADAYAPHPPIKHGFRDGLTFAELQPLMRRMRRSLRDIWEQQAELSDGGPSSGGDSLLARAMRSPDPGRVFAEAAEKGEVDPLADPDVRLWAGLPPWEEAEERSRQ